MNQRFALTAVVAVVLIVTGLGAAGGTATEAEEAWSRVLYRFVDDDGRVDFAGLSLDTADLDSFVAFVGRAGPETNPELFPNRADVLAYHLNAYNALAMRGILDAGLPDDLDGVFKRSRFFKRRKFLIDGRAQTRAIGPEPPDRRTASEKSEIRNSKFGIGTETCATEPPHQWCVDG